MLLELYDALGQKKVSNYPPEFVVGDELAYSEWPGADGNIAAATTLGTVTFTGDGINPTILEAHALAYTSAANAQGALEMYDAGVRLTHDRQDLPTVGQFGVVHGFKRLPPFLGSKTITLSNTGLVHVNRSYGILPFLRASRLRGANVVGLPSATLTAPLVSGAAQMTGGGDVAITTWQTLEWDNTGGKMFNAATPNRLIAPESGIYDISLVLAFAAGVVSTAPLYCYVQHYNAAGVQITNRLVNSSSWGPSAATSWVGGSIELNMVAGDYIVFAGAQFTGGTRNFSSTQCRFQLTKKAPNNIAQYEQTDTGWLALPTIQNGASLYNGGDANFLARYRRKNGFVYLRGLLNVPALASDTLLFTLPAGFRPSIEQHLPTISNNVFAGIGINASGQVKTKSATAISWYSLDSVSFIADQ